MTAKQSPANIRGKNKSSSAPSATCRLSTHINPEGQWLHKRIYSKCSVTSKEDIKKKKKKKQGRQKSRLMLPYRVISMDACLIRLTAETGAENKCTRSASLGSIYPAPAFGNKQQEICICSGWRTIWHLTRLQNPGKWFLIRSLVTFCWFLRGPATITSTPGEKRSPGKCVWTVNVYCNHRQCAELKQMR